MKFSDTKIEKTLVIINIAALTISSLLRVGFYRWYYLLTATILLIGLKLSSYSKKQTLRTAFWFLVAGAILSLPMGLLSGYAGGNIKYRLEGKPINKNRKILLLICITLIIASYLINIAALYLRSAKLGN